MVSEVWASSSAIADYYASGTPSMFNFDAADAEGKLIKAARGNYKAASFVGSMVGYQTEYAAENPDFIDAPFITNHDMGRVANALMKDANDMKMACTMARRSACQVPAKRTRTSGFPWYGPTRMRRE